MADMIGQADGAPPGAPNGDASASRRAAKSASAFRTISEVAVDLDVPQHVLRFWETKFSQIRPLKRGGGRRYYRPEDVELLRSIRSLLYNDGYTIKGVQKLLREGGLKSVLRPADASPAAPPPVIAASAPPAPSERRASGHQAVAAKASLDADMQARLSELIDELTALRDRLRK